MSQGPISRRRVLRQIGAGVASIAAVSRATEAGVRRAAGVPPIRLADNENPYGPSPRVAAALRAIDMSTVSRYPDVEITALRQSLARTHGVGANQIVLGLGSGEVLRMAAAAFLSPTRSLLVARPTCGVVTSHADRVGAPIVAVPLAHDWSHDVTQMAARADRSTGLVYVCNPNNPTGSLTGRARLEALVRALPRTAYVVIDEAYHHYVARSADYASFVDRPIDDDRVIVARTFSKAYGLAGLRVGYAVASPRTAALLESQALTGGITAVAAVAAAAALDDRDHVVDSVARTADDRQEFANQANARMLRIIDSHANFVMLNAAKPAGAIVDHFARNRIALPRPFAPLDEYIRVSLGTPLEMEEFWRVWDLMGLGHPA